MRQQPTTIVLASLVALAPSAHGFEPDAVFFQLGGGKGVRAAVTGVGWDFGRSWPLLGGSFSGYWELWLGHWRTTAAGGNGRAVSQIGVTPVFRYSRGAASPWFFEIGIGATFTAPVYENGDKRFSTSFNFGDHLAAGYRFGAGFRNELGLRYQHFSNGGIRHPNPGENFLQLRYTRRLE